MERRPDFDAAFLGELGRGQFPDCVGIDVTEVGDGFARTTLELRTEHLAPNGET